MLSRYLGRFPALGWPLVRLVPLVVSAAYLAVLHGPSPSTGADWALATVSATMTMMGGRWPLAVSVAQSMLYGVSLVAVELRVAPIILFLLAAVALGELWMRRGGWQCWAATALYAAVMAAVYVPHENAPQAGFSVALITLPSVLIGRYVRSVLQVAIQEHRKRERAVRDARATERTAIARELHDLVAHHIASIAVQVGAARHALNGAEPAVAAALNEVHGTARTALADLRRLMITLRDTANMTEDAGAALADPGGLPAALAVAVQQARAGGLALDAEIDPTVVGLDSMRRLAVLRVVQEGLTNVTKHAGTRARATLRVRAAAGEVLVSVCDDGGDRSAHNGFEAPTDAGFGLVGMRERVELLGGSVHAGARDRGWELTAVIPDCAPAGVHR